MPVVFERRKIVTMAWRVLWGCLSEGRIWIKMAFKGKRRRPKKAVNCYTSPSAMWKMIFKHPWARTQSLSKPSTLCKSGWHCTKAGSKTGASRQVYLLPGSVQWRGRRPVEMFRADCLGWNPISDIHSDTSQRLHKVDSPTQRNFVMMKWQSK